MPPRRRPRRPSRRRSNAAVAAMKGRVVMVAKGGAPLIEPQAIETLKRRLIPRAAVLTPNLLEAEILAGRAIDSLAAMKAAAEALLALGCQAVLLKGGHLAGDTVHDVLL